MVLSPLSPHAIEGVTVALGFLALSACGWVVYRLGSALVRPRGGGSGGADPAHARARPLLRRARVRGHPLPAARALRGARRVAPAARRAPRCSCCWRSPGCCAPRRGCSRGSTGCTWRLASRQGTARERSWALRVTDERSSHPVRHAIGLAQRSRSAQLALLAVAAPLVVGGSAIWLVTGHPLWSLTNTRHTAETLDRITGIANVPEYIPRRIGEILSPPVLLGAALGGVLSLWLLPPPGPARCGCRGRRGGRVRGVRHGRAADQHALRVPRRGDPLHLLRRRRVRLDAPSAGGPAPALVDGRAARSCSWRCSPTSPRSTTRRTAN